MRDQDLISIIQAHRRDSLGVEDGSLSNERAKAMDHYHGRPYGNEDEGRSSVVSRDLSETVDWAMPAIMRVFIQSGNIAEFDPVGPEDEQQAQQESDYVNQVFMKDNNGFLLLHDAIKDALLLKNGYVKHYWEESEKTEESSYTGLTIDEIMLLTSQLEQDGAKFEIVGQEERSMIVDSPMGPVPVQVFDVKIRSKKKIGKCRIEAVPCEEVRVSKRCRGSLQDSPFVEHVTRKTRSYLIEIGMDRKFVDSLPAMSERDNSSEVLARDSVDDESQDYGGSSFNDRAMDEIEYCEAYLRVDWDGDGVAELRKVVTVADRIPPGDEWNETIDAVPITGGVPKRVPHRHVGESLDDELSDLQQIKTTLMRQLLDNIYLTNNNQWLVNERVNLSDFMQSLPGGIKRIRGLDPIAGSVEAVQATPIIGQVLPAIDYIDSVKDARTGINKTTTGLDPDVLKQSTKGAFLENLNKASQKIEMITRMLAETLVKEAVLQVHGILRRHQDKARMVKLRGKFVPVNPSEWQERTDLTARVGLGTGSEEEKREKLMLIATAQEKMAPLGLVGPVQAYNLFSDLAKAMGFDMPEKYAVSPESEEFKQKQQQPPPEPPQVTVKKMELQADAQRFQAETQIGREKAQYQAEIDERQAQQNLLQEQARSQNDLLIEREKIAATMELERYKAQLKAETDIKIAMINAEISERSRMQGAAEMHREMTGGGEY